MLCAAVSRGGDRGVAWGAATGRVSQKQRLAQKNWRSFNLAGLSAIRKPQAKRGAQLSGRPPIELEGGLGRAAGKRRGGDGTSETKGGLPARGEGEAVSRARIDFTSSAAPYPIAGDDELARTGRSKRLQRRGREGSNRQSARCPFSRGCPSTVRVHRDQTIRRRGPAQPDPAASQRSVAAAQPSSGTARL